MRARTSLCLLGLLQVATGCSEPVTPMGDASIDHRMDRGDAAMDGAASDGATSDASAMDAGPCSACRAYERCFAETCVPRLGTCASNDDCVGDSYCAEDMTCVPYGVPAGRTRDEMCQRPAVPSAVQPAVQCAWDGPPAGDPTAAFTSIYTALMVSELNLDGSARRIDPSIVGITFGSAGGVRRGILRVWSGRTCQEQMRIGLPGSAAEAANEPGYGSQIAIGDLDGDLTQADDTVTGHPEIVTLHRRESDGDLDVVAYGIEDRPGETPAHRLVRKWVGRRCDMPGEPSVRVAAWTFNAGPSLVDLDDDGRPEVLYERQVFDRNGCALNDPTSGTTGNYLTLGVLSIAVDVDRDGAPELVSHDGIYRWDTAMRRWAIESYWAPTMADAAQMRNGHVAVADFGDFAAPSGITGRVPEVVVVSNANESYAGGSTSQGTVRVQTVGGRVVFGPVPVFGNGSPGGHGGPPTAADFDGDGWPEIGVAGGRTYAVYDPDCDPAAASARAGGTCTRPMGAAAIPGVLWWKPSQDASSSATGSSVFDFNGDGRAEAVYRDECYLRVYDGANGAVLYSAAARSGTGYELPTIVDADGDFATEIIVPRAGAVSCPTPDPIAPAGTMADVGAGTAGFVVLRDAMDRWVPSRPIWNQHAYHITNVTDDAHIPRSSMAQRNWDVPRLNHFRQNSQGALAPVGIADITVSLTNAADLCVSVGNVTLRSRVCNRGTNPVSDGALIRFEQPGVDAGRRTICEARTDVLLSPGDCTNVSCAGEVTADGARSIEVVADPQGSIADCHSRNNRGIIPVGACPG